MSERAATIKALERELSAVERILAGLDKQYKHVMGAWSKTREFLLAKIATLKLAIEREKGKII